MAHRRHNNLKKIGAVTASGALLATWIIVAMNNDGIANAQIELNDGGVWVTNNDKQLVGHLNYPAMTLDSTVRTSAEQFDIDQSADSILFQDQNESKIAPVDPAYVTFGTESLMEGATAVDMRGHTIAVYDPVEGTLWSGPFDQSSSVKSEANIVADDVVGGQITVSESGSVQLASVEDRTWIVDDEELTFPAAIEDEARVQVAFVGEEPVLLDQDGKILHYADGNSSSIDGDQLQLQISGPESDVALVASSTELLEIPLNGSEATRIPASGNESEVVPGNASQPVMHNGCSYSAWSGTGTFVRNCDGEDFDLALSNQFVANAQAAIFRTNRDVIVLNDTASGKVWLPDENLQLVDNWEQVTTEDDSADEENEEESNTLSDEPVDPEMQEENRAPIAEDDTFGARAGSVTVLPVLLNDSDEDGDILTVDIQRDSDFGEVTRIRGGSAFQITLDPDASGSTSFTYTVNDGRGGEDSANVTVNVHDESMNSAPEQIVTTKVKLAQKGRVTVEALGDWLDPDGDPIYLKDVQSVEGIDVRFRQNGSIELTDIGATPGLKQVPVIVSDGSADGEGAIQVEMTDVSAKPPVANADHVTVTVGETVQLNPLTNDTDPNGDSLRLVSIGSAPEGILARASTTLGTVSISATKVGTYYLTYSVSDGTASSTGKIRVDAVEASDQTDPVAESDLAMLPAGGSVLVDVLSNDWDPVGGVLTVVGVDVPENSPLRVAPLKYEMVRVTAPQGLAQPATFTYTISNGVGTAEGTVLVVPTEANTGNEPPEVKADRLVVRAGDVGTVAVLDNDFSPAGHELSVSPILDYSFDESAGEPFVSDNLVRFRATDQAGEYKVVYTVTDPMGNVASATVTINVVPVDPENNTAPTPRDVTVRTMAGKPVRIQIPLEGIDAEGDTVEIMGMSSSPRLGSVEQMNDGTFIYTPHETSSGTDSFTYQVRDAFGAVADAQVRVGIAPRPEINQNPVAQNDSITVRPGARVEVPVISNDVDPDGDEIFLSPGATTSYDPNLLIEEQDNLVVVTAPMAEGTYSVSYRVEDERGGSARGLLTVNVQEDSPLLPPVAVDDYPEIEGEPTNITVEVLENDYDPDGSKDELIVSSEDPGVTVEKDGRLTIETSNEQRRVLYTVTDIDGGYASAIVWVPPVLKAGEEDPDAFPELIAGSLITVNAGEPTEIDINDYITPEVEITDPSKVTASVGWNGAALPTSTTMLEFTSEDDFAGRTSITLEVETASGVVGTVTLPVEVVGKNNRPPTFVGNVVEVGAGEDPMVLNLSAMSEDPDGDDLTFTMLSAPDGLSVSLDGDRLSISAPIDAPLGGAGNVQIEVSDGEATAQGSIPVSVVATSAPTIQIQPISQTANAGETVRIDVAAAAINPFPDPMTMPFPPALISGNASISHSGTTVSITPNGHGEVVVGFTLRDATGQASRDVNSTITLTVRDAPDAPVLTGVDKQGDSSVIVAWNAGATNGAPFTGFTLRDITQGDSKECGVATQCVMTNRTMGQEHTFQVIAKNEVGQSEPSNTMSIMMDVVPDQMAAPTIEAVEGGVLNVSWAAPVSRGTPVQSVEVCLNGGQQCSGALGASTRSHQFRVAPGTEHFATVTATNQEGTSVPSAQSVSAMAWSAPSAPTNLAVTQQGLGNTSVVTFSWAAPAQPNGAGPFTYNVQAAGLDRTGITGTSITFQASEVYGVNETFSVQAVGAKASSDTSSTTASVFGDVPAAPSGGAVSAPGPTSSLVVSPPAKPGSTGGWTADMLTWQYQIAPGGAWTALGDGNISSGLTNGQQTSINLRLVGSANGSTITGAAASAGSATPYGPIVAPTLECTTASTTEINCAVGADGGDGGLGATYSVTGAGQTHNAQPGGTVTFGSLTPGTTYDFTLTATQNTTGDKATSTSSVTTEEPVPTIADYPNPTYTFAQSTNTSTCNTPDCAGATAPRVLVTLSGYMPGEQVVCSTHEGVYTGPNITVEADGSKVFELQMYGYAEDGTSLGYAVSTDTPTSYTIWRCSRGTPTG